MQPKKIPLREIERSITINCAIDHKSKKALQLPKRYQGLTNQGLGRCIFIYLAQQVGYMQEEICDYLTMSDTEFEHKNSIITELYDIGRMLFESTEHPTNYQDTRDNYLFFYRKLVLAQNYLRYRFG
jgi:hypothetical protein